MKKETLLMNYVREKCVEIKSYPLASQKVFTKFRKGKLTYSPRFKYNQNYTTKENFILARNKVDEIFLRMRDYFAKLEE